MKKKDLIEDIDDNDSEMSTVFSDLMSFLTGLFILLFTLVYNQQDTSSYLSEINIRFGGKVIEQTKKSTEEVFVEDIENYIEDHQLTKYAMTVVTSQKIRLILNDPIIFKSGTSELTKNSIKILNGISQIIRRIKNPIIIEGHTDDVPVKPNKIIRSNWDLGYYRASAVAQNFILNGVSPNQLGVTSYGEFRPIETAKTQYARKKNRRIEISIIRLKKKQK